MVRLIILSVLTLVVLVTKHATADVLFSVQEIATMNQFGVKMALEGEKTPRVVPLNITQAQLTQTEVLDFSGLPLVKLPDWVARFTKLRYLNLKGTGLEPLPLVQLQSMAVLETLDLADNPQLAVPATQLGSLWAHLPNVHQLNLANTGGDAAAYGDLSALKNLNKLDLSHNKISTIAPLGLANLPTLREINLGYNQLTTIDMRQVSYPVLTRLDLSHNQLQTIAFTTDLPQLQFWQLGDNQSGLQLGAGYGGLFQLQNLMALDVDSDAVLPEGLRQKMQRLKELEEQEKKRLAEEKRKAECLASLVESQLATRLDIKTIDPCHRYFKISNEGKYLPYDAPVWACVYDKAKNLSWEVKYADKKYKWDDIGQRAVEVNQVGLCGHYDWRVPTIEELKSLVKPGEKYPSIDTEYFPNTDASYFWSSSPDAYSSNLRVDHSLLRWRRQLLPQEQCRVCSARARWTVILHFCRAMPGGLSLKTKSTRINRRGDRRSP